MLTTDALLRAAVSGTADELTLTLDPAFQGLPDTAHGGTLLALFEALADLGDQPRRIAGHYRRRVPLGVPLRLDLTRAADGVACRVPVDVVDVLEVVEVDDDDGERLVGAARARDGLPDPVVEQGAVREACERVTERM